MRISAKVPRVNKVNLTISFKLYRYIPSDYVDFIILTNLYQNITDMDILLSRENIWANKHNRSIKKINQLIIKSFNRYTNADKKKINIKKYLL